MVPGPALKVKSSLPGAPSKDPTPVPGSMGPAGDSVIASRPKPSLLWHYRTFGGSQAYWWHNYGPACASKRQRAAVLLEKTPQAQLPELSEQKVAQLAQYLEERGGTGELLEGWSAKTEVRKTGHSAGHTDLYWFSSSGRRFRSMAEVARFFGLTP
eukprot:g23939.t1